MKVGIIIARIGGIDGVALETEKWIDILVKQKHEIFIITGSNERLLPLKYDLTISPILSFFSPECLREQDEAFYSFTETPEELVDFIEQNGNKIFNILINWASEKNLDYLIIQNASSLPSHISLGVGINKAVQKLCLPTLAHNHDFAWERGIRYQTPHKLINNIMATNFPLKQDHVKNVVINTPAKESMQRRYKLSSTMIPNVMDFSKPYAQDTATNKKIKEKLKVEQDDILLFQITRIVARKGIGVAINLIHKLNNPKVKLVITGDATDDHGDVYLERLKNRIKKLGIEKQILFAGDLFSRHSPSDNVYTLDEAYAVSNACTYFSLYEGFGNAFVEAICAKKPIFVNNYKPVFEADLKSKKFDVVVIEDNLLTDDSIQQIEKVIYHSKDNIERAEYNYQIAKQHFSYEVLEQHIDALVN